MLLSLKCTHSAFGKNLIARIIEEIALRIPSVHIYLHLFSKTTQTLTFPREICMIFLFSGVDRSRRFTI